MFTEASTETSLTPYQDYLETGGQFTETDYQLLIDFSSGFCDIDCHSKPSRDQIVNLGCICKIPLTDSEIAIYSALRVKMPPQETLEFDTIGVHVWEMSDQRLAMNIFHITDPTGEKCEAVGKQFFNREETQLELTTS